MPITKTRQVSDTQQSFIAALWNREYPLSLRKDDEGIADYLRSRENPLHFFLTDENGDLAGWSVLFDRDGGRWFALLLAATVHGKGYGTHMLNLMKEQEPVLNCWVVDHSDGLKADGSVYRSPLRFYEKNGFTAVPGVRLETAEMSGIKMNWHR